MYQNQGFHQKQKELKAGLKTNLQCTSKGSIQEAQLETCTMTEVPVLSQNAAPGHMDKATLGSQVRLLTTVIACQKVRLKKKNI